MRSGDDCVQNGERALSFMLASVAKPRMEELLSKARKTLNFSSTRSWSAAGFGE
jgi:hypothetical protein